MQANDDSSQGPAGSKRSNDERIRPQSLLLPPIAVLAHPWTTLASDEVVSHLVSLYFTWEQPCLQFVDKNAFVADMKIGEPTRRGGFCSSLLVSALLAQACVGRPSWKLDTVLPIDLVADSFSSSSASARSVRTFE